MKILFLGYGPDDSPLPYGLAKRGAIVHHRADKLDPNRLHHYDLVVSYGYRHIIPASTVHLARDLYIPLVNIHIGYLPFNRGAHPTYWAAKNGTPQGVTIHLIDEGIDTGPILWRQMVLGTVGTTWFNVYRDMREAAEQLFFANIEDIMLLRFNPVAQPFVTKLNVSTPEGKHHYKNSNIRYGEYEAIPEWADKNAKTV